MLTEGIESSEKISCMMHYGEMQIYFPEYYAELMHGCDKRGIKRDIICADTSLDISSDARTTIWSKKG